MGRPAFGYRKTSSNRVVPDKKQLAALQDVKEMIDAGELSWREASLYLSNKTNRHISHEGVRKRLRKPVILHAVQNREDTNSGSEAGEG